MKSNKNEMTCGVPQGSILGTILIIILINEMPNASYFFTLFPEVLWNWSTSTYALQFDSNPKTCSKQIN